MRVSRLLSIPVVAALIGVALIPLMRHGGIAGAGVFALAGLSAVVLAAFTAVGMKADGPDVALITLMTAALYLLALAVLLVLAAIAVGGALRDG